MKSFQTLFPPLAPQTLSLSSARRVVLVSYNAGRGTVDFRHYVITVKPYGVSRRVRRVLEGATTASSEKASRSSRILDLGNENDVADFVLRKRGESAPDGGYESAASSAESIAGDEGDAVSLAEDYVGRNNKKGQKRAVRLDEVGPRMELRLVKITEGVPGKDGSVIFHQYGLFSLTLFNNCLNIITVKKSKKEVATLSAEHAAREKLRKERREQQERNVQRKREAQDEDDQRTDASVEDDEGEDNAMWDEDEEVTDGEEESSEDEELQRPTKKTRMRDKL
jgi:ribosome biogenesis protein SSF1/2